VGGTELLAQGRRHDLALLARRGREVSLARLAAVRGEAWGSVSVAPGEVGAAQQQRSNSGRSARGGRRRAVREEEGGCEDGSVQRSSSVGRGGLAIWCRKFRAALNVSLGAQTGQRGERDGASATRVHARMPLLAVAKPHAAVGPSSTPPSPDPDVESFAPSRSVPLAHRSNARVVLISAVAVLCDAVLLTGRGSHFDDCCRMGVRWRQMPSNSSTTPPTSLVPTVWEHRGVS
jgi:hypothetical protein